MNTILTNKDLYLGDGLYVSDDGYHVILYTTDGLRKTNEVFLDPQVLRSFLCYLEQLKKWTSENDLNDKKEDELL